LQLLGDVADGMLAASAPPAAPTMAGLCSNCCGDLANLLAACSNKGEECNTVSEMHAI
jgi:hypothetical protein